MGGSLKGIKKKKIIIKLPNSKILGRGFEKEKIIRNWNFKPQKKKRKKEEAYNSKVFKLLEVFK